MYCFTRKINLRVKLPFSGNSYNKDNNIQHKQHKQHKQQLVYYTQIYCSSIAIYTFNVYISR